MRVRSVVAQPGDRAGWVRTGPDTAIPLRFDGYVVLDEPLCEVAMRVIVRQGVPAVEAFSVSRVLLPLPGPAVTMRLLRGIAVDELLRRVTTEVTEPIVDFPDPEWVGAFQLVRDVEAGSTQGWGGRPAKAAAGRGRHTVDERLARVADIYRAAVAAGGSPTRAVANQLPCSYSHAARLVGQARSAGYL